MKRMILTGLLIVCLLFLLTACGEVGKTEDAIEAIGTVTLESREAIELAEELYRGLPASKQEKVDNYRNLLDARARWDQLFDAVSNARSAISSIGQVTLDSGSIIEKARNAYDALSPEGLTGYVSDVYPVLLEAEGQYDTLVKEYAQTLLEKADTLLKRRKYQEAYELYSLILTEYGSYPVSTSATNGCADALAGLADSQYRSNKLEDALLAVEEIISTYGTTDAVSELKEKIETKLHRNRPANGKVFKNTIGGGNGEFTVNASSSDACIKLENMENPSKYILFYVRANESATVKVKDGDYIAKYATGENWYGADTFFGRDTTFTRADEIMSYETTHYGSYIYYSAIEITLYQVVGGNMTTSPIGANDF